MKRENSGAPIDSLPNRRLSFEEVDELDGSDGLEGAVPAGCVESSIGGVETGAHEILFQFDERYVVVRLGRVGWYEKASGERPWVPGES